jgi:molybdate transport system substrate-binding protein
MRRLRLATLIAVAAATALLAGCGSSTSGDAGVPAGVNAATSYPIATLTASKNPDLAKAFVDYVLSADGAGVLTAAGFREP